MPGPVGIGWQPRPAVPVAHANQLPMYDVIIIGAGQAGLAAGFHTRRLTGNFLLLESHGRVGDSWRQRWEGLRLFTPQRYNGLPGLPTRGGDWELIDRMRAAEYLERYARHFALPVRTDCTCVSAQKFNDHWRLTTSKGELRTRRLVVASGAYKDPHIPKKVAASVDGEITQLHSSEVRSVSNLVRGPTAIAIVGAGASGQQLARLCAGAGAKVTLLGAKVGNLPRAVAGKDIYWWLYKSGLMNLRTDRWPGSAMKGSSKGIVTVGEGELPAGITHAPRKLTGITGGNLLLDDGRQIAWPPAGHRGVVIWCTGYRNRYSFLPNDHLNEVGQPLQSGGVSTTDPTLAFMGMENLRHVNSSLLGGVGQDAEQIIPLLFNDPPVKAAAGG